MFDIRRSLRSVGRRSNQLNQLSIGNRHSARRVHFLMVLVVEKIVVEFRQVHHTLKDRVPEIDRKIHETSIPNVVETHQTQSLGLEDFI